jgi:hypothetical protein
MRWDFWRRKRRETDLEDEIAHDLALEAEEQIHSGVAPREAQLASRRDFGNVGLLKEGIRETWGWASLERLGRDVRYGWRTLRKSPLFASMAVLSLALGIGANASIFSVINAILLRPLPGVERASEVVSLNEKRGLTALPLVSYPDYRDFRDRNSVLTGLAAMGFVPASIGQKGNCQRLFGYTVTGNYFEVLGVKPLAGRLIQPEDDQVRGGHPVIVLSYSGWQKRFGGDPNIVGAKVQVNGREFTVLGITPQGFFGTELFFAPDVFFSVAMQKELEGGNGFNDLDHRTPRGLFAVGRLKPGVTVARAESALDAIGRQLALEYPQDDGGMQVKLAPPGLAGAFLRKPILQFAAALFGVSCLVLLVACVNLATRSRST